MKKISTLFAAFLFTIISINLYAQCEPDLENCIDINDPGQICPIEMPDGVIDEVYSQVVTIIPPYESELEQGVVPLLKIIMDSIVNLPPGLSVESNAEEFLVGTAYCVLLSGMPTVTGVFELSIYVTPFISFAGIPVVGPQQVDDTSLTITIGEAVYAEQFNQQKIINITNAPNPFVDFTSVEFTAPFQGEMELAIYDYLGNEKEKRHLNYKKGVNSITLDASNYHQGFYFLILKDKDQVYTKKIIKL